MRCRRVLSWGAFGAAATPKIGSMPPFHGGSGARMSLLAFRVLSHLSHKALGLLCCLLSPTAALCPTAGHGTSVVGAWSGGG